MFKRNAILPDQIPNPKRSSSPLIDIPTINLKEKIRGLRLFQNNQKKIKRKKPYGDLLFKR